MGEDESPTEALGPALGQAALEGVFPGVGSVVGKMGKGLAGSALKLSDEMKNLLGRGDPLKGSEEFARRLEKVPGVRLRTTAMNAGKIREGAAVKKRAEVGLATQAGTKIDPASDVLFEALDKLYTPGTGKISARIGPKSLETSSTNVLDRFTDQISGLTNQGKIDPNQAMDMLDKTPFEASGDQGTDQAVIALRSALSSALKGTSPGVKSAYDELADIIPVEEVLKSAASGGGAPNIFPELVGGFSSKLVRPLTIIRPPRFATGRATQRVGKALSTQPGYLPALIRALGGGE
jgi:hypothetical protein